MRVQTASWTLCRGANQTLIAVCSNASVALSNYSEGEEVYVVSKSVHSQIKPQPVSNAGNVVFSKTTAQSRGAYVAKTPIIPGDIFCVQDPDSTTVRSAWAPKVKGLDIYANAVQPVYTALTINRLG